MKEADVTGMETESKKPAISTDLAKMPAISIQVKNIDLDMEEIKKWIAPTGATAKEIYTFGRICQTLNLSPFKKEIYFIKYGSMDASIVVGYTVYIDRAERSGKLDGWQVKMDDNRNPTEATIIIFRKDWSQPFKWTVYREEVEKLKKDGTPQSTWATQPRFQLMKCAIGQGFRLAFPSECGELPYTAEEIGDTNGYLPQIPEARITEAEVTGAEVIPDNAATLTYLSGQYFQLANQYFSDEDARHIWQENQCEAGILSSSSASTMTVEDFEKAIDLIKAYMEDGSTVWDSPETAPNTEDEPEIAMESADAVQSELDTELAAKQARVAELIADTPIKTIDAPGFTTWWHQLLPEEVVKQFDELGVLDLDIIIAAIETRIDSVADDASKKNGDLF